MGQFVQLVVDGLSTGSVYAAIALAIVLVHSATGLINFAQGGLAVLAAYVAWVLTNRGMPLVVAILLFERRRASVPEERPGDQGPDPDQRQGRRRPGRPRLSPALGPLNAAKRLGIKGTQCVGSGVGAGVAVLGDAGVGARGTGLRRAVLPRVAACGRTCVPALRCIK